MNGRGGMTEQKGAFWIWFIGFLAIVCVHSIWEIRNDRPEIWDMAHHQLMGWSYLQAWNQGELLQRFGEISGYYPPLYYLKEALVLALFGWEGFSPLLANLPGLFLFSFFTYRLALTVLRPLAAALAGLWILLLPMVAWLSRESLLDVTLGGWVVCALWLLHKSRGFERLDYSILFGLAAGFGMLTKWTFALFLLTPALWMLFRGQGIRRRAVHALAAALASIPLWAGWYWENLPLLTSRFQSTAEAAILEHDPPFWHPLGWFYYIRCLSSYYLFLPLTLLAAYAFVDWKSLARGNSRWILATLLGGGLLLTLLQAKDPRYILPLASLLVMLMLTPLQNSLRAMGLMTVLVCGQFLAVSFAIPSAPGKIALFSQEPDPDYTNLAREWVFFTPDYLGVTGPPRREDWCHGRIAEMVERESRVAFIPDAPFFHPAALLLEAVRKGKPIEVFRVGASENFVPALNSAAWAVGKTGAQGISYITRYNDRVYSFLEEEHWQLAASCPLPDGSEAQIWRNPIR